MIGSQPKECGPRVTSGQLTPMFVEGMVRKLEAASNMSTHGISFPPLAISMQAKLWPKQIYDLVRALVSTAAHSY